MFSNSSLTVQNWNPVNFDILMGTTWASIILMGTTWTCINSVGSIWACAITLLLKMVGDIKIAHLIEVQHIQMYWIQQFFFVGRCYSFSAASLTTWQSFTITFYQMSKTPFTYIPLALACQISYLLSQISFSPFKIFLTNPSNLLFCTGKVNSIHAVKRGGGVPPLILNLSIRWRWVVWIHALPTLKPEKVFPVSFTWRHGGPQSYSAHCWEQKDILPLVGTEPWILSCPAHILATIPPMFVILLMRNWFLQTPCARRTVFVSHHYPLLYNCKLAGLGGCTCSSARKEVCKMCCLRLLKAGSMSLHTS